MSKSIPEAACFFNPFLNFASTGGPTVCPCQPVRVLVTACGVDLFLHKAFITGTAGFSSLLVSSSDVKLLPIPEQQQQREGARAGIKSVSVLPVGKP